MKIKHLLRTTALFFMIMSSCHNNEETVFLKETLDKFGISIPESPHIFIIIPYYSCAACVKRTWNYLEDSMISSKNITIIDAYRSGKDPFIKHLPFPIYIDSCYIIENGRKQFSNPTIIHTNKHEVSSIIELPSNNIEQSLKVELLSHQ